MPLNNPNPAAPQVTPQVDANGTMSGDLPGSEAATGEEQASYEKVVMAGLKDLFEDDTTSKAIVEQLKTGAENPAQSIADVTTMLITALDEQSGGQIPDAVILPAAGEILANVAQLANDADVFPVDQNIMGQAAQIMIVAVAERFGAEPGELEEMMGTLDEPTLNQIQTSQSQFGGPSG